MRRRPPTFFRTRSSSRTISKATPTGSSSAPPIRCSIGGGCTPATTCCGRDIHVKPGETDATGATNETADPQQQVALRSSMDLPGSVTLDAALRWVDTLHINNGPTAGRSWEPCRATSGSTRALAWHVSKRLELSVAGQNLLHESSRRVRLPVASARADRAQCVCQDHMGLLKTSTACPLRRGLALLLLACALAGAAAPVSEYQLKAVFLFNFAQFVEWPAAAFPRANAPFVIGVLGKDPFGASLDDVVRGESVERPSLRHRALSRRYRDPRLARSCSFPASELGQLDEILTRSRDTAC